MLPQLITILTIVTILCLSNCTDICSIIYNENCSCVSSNDDRQSTVKCTFDSNITSPLFLNDWFTIANPLVVGTLDLSNNTLRSLPDNFLPNHVALDTLLLSDNYLMEVPAGLSKLNRLTTLDLAGNDLKAWPIDVLMTIPGLRHVDLSMNRLTDQQICDTYTNKDDDVEEDMEAAKKPGWLLSINLSGNLLTRLTKDSLAFAGQSLSKLDISYNQLRKVDQKAFHHFTKGLLKLDLSHNELHVGEDGFNPKCVNELRRLRHLNLSGNPLGILDQLILPPHLRLMDVSDCAMKVSDHCKLSLLADLNHVILKGNQSQCTCGLYHLHRWCKSISCTLPPTDPETLCANNTAPPDKNLSSKEWFCRETSNIESRKGDGNRRKLGATVKVSELETCQNEDNGCHATQVSYCRRQRDYTKLETPNVTIRMAVSYPSSSEALVSWTVDGQQVAAIEGFVITYTSEDGRPSDSRLVGPAEREFRLPIEDRKTHHVVCLTALSGQPTRVMQQICQGVTAWSSNLVVGIVSGTAFLIPCLVIILYIVVKDRSLSRYNHLHTSGVESSREDEKPQNTKHHRSDAQAKQGENRSNAVQCDDDAKNPKLEEKTGEEELPAKDTTNAYDNPTYVAEDANTTDLVGITVMNCSKT